MNKQVFKRWLPLGVLLAIGIVVWVSGVAEVLSFESIKAHRTEMLEWVTLHPVLSVVLFVLVYGVSVTLSLPIATVLTLLGGFLFGRWWGTLLVVIAATSGATLVFVLAKSSVGNALRDRAGELYKKVSKQMEGNAVGYMLFMRLVPLFPFVLVNIIPALFNVRLVPYVLTTFFGIIPGTFVYVNVGTELGRLESVSDLVSFETLLAFTLLGVFALVPSIYKQLKGKKSEG